MDKKRNSEQFFRYLVVSSLKAELLKGIPISKAIKKVVETDFYTFEGEVKYFSSRTLYRWHILFKKYGINGLLNQKKSNEAKFKLSEQQMLFIKKVKEKDPIASVTEIIKQGILSDIFTENTSRTTVYRACKRMNLPLLRSVSKNQDMRRFSYPHRMNMILCDGKHFRAGKNKNKRVVLIYIDDSTRFILHHIVGTSETTELFLKGLYELILKYGLMSAIYLDKGPAFKSLDTASVLASLNISLYQGRARYPEGHGKVERFNRTIKKDLLRGLARDSVDTNLNALNIRLGHYIEKTYNISPHSSLNGKSPQETFNNDDSVLTFFENRKELKQKFVLKEKRKVSKDNIITVNGNSIELPIGYAGTIVEIFKNILDNIIFIYHNGCKIHLYEVDLHLNANSRRGKFEIKNNSTAPITLASDISYQRDTKPIVDSYGNFYEEEEL